MRASCDSSKARKSVLFHISLKICFALFVSLPFAQIFELLHIVLLLIWMRNSFFVHRKRDKRVKKFSKHSEASEHCEIPYTNIDSSCWCRENSSCGKGFIIVLQKSMQIGLLWVDFCHASSNYPTLCSRAVNNFASLYEIIMGKQTKWDEWVII